MTADAFTTAARAEAEQYAYEWAPTIGMTGTVARAFMAGAEWSRDHLAAQEPTDAEVEAAAESLCGADMEVHGFSSEEAVNILHGRWVRLEDTHRNAYLATARAALTAAKEARG